MTPLEQFRKLMADAGASPEWIEFVTPGFVKILREANRGSYAQGSRDGSSRTRNSPGDGDMGG